MQHPNWLVEKYTDKSTGEQWLIEAIPFDEAQVALEYQLVLIEAGWHPENVVVREVTQAMRDEWDIVALEMADQRLLDYAR